MIKSQQGISLLEILIITASSALIGGILVVSFVNFQNLFTQSTTQSLQGISINDAVVNISDSIKQSSAVSPSVTIGSTTYNSSVQTIVLQYPSFDSSGNIISQKYDYIVVTPDQADSKILRQFVFPDPVSSRQADTKMLTNGLSLISFSYFDSLNNPVSPSSATRVSFTINLSEKSGLDFKTSSASGKANIKNL